MVVEMVLVLVVKMVLVLVVEMALVLGRCNPLLWV
jgi:hypothetical protein